MVAKMARLTDWVTYTLHTQRWKQGSHRQQTAWHLYCTLQASNCHSQKATLCTKTYDL